MQKSGPPNVGSALSGRDEEHGPPVGDLRKAAVESAEILRGVDHLGLPEVHLS